MEMLVMDSLVSDIIPLNGVLTATFVRKIREKGFIESFSFQESSTLILLFIRTLENIIKRLFDNHGKKSFSSVTKSDIQGGN